MNFTDIVFDLPEDVTRATIGILGGGGKTALLHRLGEELSQRDGKVALTSLTKAGQSDQFKVHFYADIISRIKEQESFKPNPYYIMGHQGADEKLEGLSAQQLDKLRHIANFSIFECDGARKRPIKAHQPYDPPLPEFTTHGVIIVGADAVGAKVDGKLIHRPERFRELWDVNANYQLEPEFIAKVLTSHYGYLQKVPRGVRLSYLVNKSDAHPDDAQKLAHAISRLTAAPVFCGSLEKNSLEQIHLYS